MKTVFLLSFVCLASGCLHALTLKSPDGSLTVQSTLKNELAVEKNGLEIFGLTADGLKVDGKIRKPKLNKVLKESHISDDYVMLTGKKKHCTNEANEYILPIDKNGEMQLRVYNDGIALRYVLNNCNGSVVNEDLTSYVIQDSSSLWLQKYNESYEAFFPKTVAAAAKQGQWGYPALIQSADNVYALISEANISRNNSASRLSNEKQTKRYNVVLAPNESKIQGQWATPWRVAIVGDLETLVQSTLITDLSESCKLDNTDWIEPGVVSWVYWAYNHGSKDYQIVKKYIDMAKILSLPYVLIDAEWDEMYNGGNINDAVAYSLSQGVKPIIWYNSSTAWTQEGGAPGPHKRLNDPVKREVEFAKIAEMGVAGVKIDFFSGDTQSTMEYCIDLLECAAKHHLLVNFHGATIPRGWQRTYPHLMSVEAVYGAEWYNNAPTLTNRAAQHNATLPFTRNIIGSMDYTPCTFSDSQHTHITSKGHELALTVLFESGLQHLADKPESYLSQPLEVQHFLSQLPSTWDETRLIGGLPGEWVALARRNGETWYVGIINGTDQEKSVAIDWSKILGSETLRQFTTYADNKKHKDHWQVLGTYDNLPSQVSLIPRGGQVFVIN